MQQYSLAQSGFLRAKRGMTLVEVMVAFGLFTILASGVVGTLIQSRKFAEINIYEATAQTMAQSIIEQVQLVPFAKLSEVAAPTATLDPVSLHFVAATADNNAVLQELLLPWVPDTTSEINPAGGATFTDIGAVVDGKPQGVLLDLDYRTQAGAVVRPKKYMKMQVKLSKHPNDANGNVVVILVYRWELPNRRNADGVLASVFETRELRTVRSQTASY